MWVSAYICKCVFGAKVSMCTVIYLFIYFRIYHRVSKETRLKWLHVRDFLIQHDRHGKISWNTKIQNGGNKATVNTETKMVNESGGRGRWNTIRVICI